MYLSKKYGMLALVGGAYRIFNLVSALCRLLLGL